jgi:hypothetical protein
MPELGDGVTGLVELREETAGTGRVFVQHAGITPSGRYLASAITPWRGRSTWTRPSRAGLALDLIAISCVI